MLLLWFLAPLLWSFAPQVQAVVCWYVTDKYVCVASYLTCSSLLLIADWSSLLVFFFFLHTSTFQLLDIQAVVTDVVLPFPPPVYCLHCVLAHRVQHPLIVDFSSSVVANSRSRAFSKSTRAQDDKLYEYALGGFELTKLT